MFRKILYALWVVFYGVCALLGMREPGTAVQAGAMTLWSVIFFIPPGILVGLALRDRDHKALRLIRIISILSLTLTTVCLIVNIAVVGASDKVGNVMYAVLNFLSVPMICSRHFVLSMFLWACLLLVTFPKLVFGDKEKKS